MNSTLAHPNMKGRIIICQTPRRGHEFLRPLSYKMARPPAGSPDRAAGFPTLIFLRPAGWYFGLKSNLPHKLQLVIFPQMAYSPWKKSSVERRGAQRETK